MRISTAREPGIAPSPIYARIIERLPDNALNIFTDGSQLPKPRRGGCAFIFVTTNEAGTEESYESFLNGSKGSTNQEMEIKAAVEALKLALSARSPVDLKRFDRIVIYTDSQFLESGADRSANAWSKQGWNRRGGAPLVNTQLWRELLRLRKRSPIPVIFEWRKGKSSKYTKRVDELAKESANRPYDRPPTIRSLGHKETTESVEAGSVPVVGQVMTIKIIEAMNNRLQRRWRFKYEVVSDGPDNGKVDYVFGRDHLMRRYIYTVRLNDDPDFPQIAEILETEEASKTR